MEDRVIVNIGGNKSRLVVHVNYDYGIVFVKFVGRRGLSLEMIRRLHNGLQIPLEVLIGRAA